MVEWIVDDVAHDVEGHVDRAHLFAFGKRSRGDRGGVGVGDRSLGDDVQRLLKVAVVVEERPARRLVLVGPIEFEPHGRLLCSRARRK